MKVGIVGYGNLGKAVEEAVLREADLELVGVFTRRQPEKIRTFDRSTKVFPYFDIERFRGNIDVIINCTGSAKDLPETTPFLAGLFCTVDSFDTHADFEAHRERVDESAKASGKVALISAGWDPGLFSVFRAFCGEVFPSPQVNTFWGEGISEGHSDAARKIDGVADARAVTLPEKDILKAALAGINVSGDTAELHRRVCYVVPREGADRVRIAKDIRSIPGYFEGFETDVRFVSSSELARKVPTLFHAGNVICNFKAGKENLPEQAVLSLKLSSNPVFTACITVAGARAAHRMYLEGQRGCKTVFDIPISYFMHGNDFSKYI